MMRSRVVLLLLGIGFSISLIGIATSHAAEGDCIDTDPYTFYGTSGEREYRIKVTSIDYLQNITRDEGVAAIVMGAEVWNEEANAGYFVNGPTTSKSSIPESFFQCWYQGINYSLVAVDSSTCSYHLAITSPRCGGTQFQIIIYSKNQYCGYRNYYVGQTGPTTPAAFDLPSVMSHEFGHTLGLDHPASGEYATMQTGFDAGDDRRRDLYYWDTKCTDELSGDRSLTTYRRDQYSNNSWSSQEFTFQFNEPIFKVAALMSTYSGWYFGATVFAGSDGLWERDSGYPPKRLYLDTNTSLGITGGSWREDTSNDRVFFPRTYSTNPYYDKYSKHYIQYRRSTNGFQSYTTGSLYHCTDMNGWMTCNGYQQVYSGKRVAFTWDNYSDRTVFVWANQTRLCAETGSEHEKAINIAVGYIYHTMLPEPDVRLTTKNIRGVNYSYPIATSVGPAVACNEDSANGNDCLVAYVELNDPENRIWFINFWNRQLSDRYHITNVSTPYEFNLNVQTASNLALWYHGGKFWLAVRPIRTSTKQKLEIFYSSNGVNWTQDTSFGSKYSATGPSAITTCPECSVNMLLYPR